MHTATVENPIIKPCNAAAQLNTPKTRAKYLKACIGKDSDDAALFTQALRNMARTHGMTNLARDTGVSREGLYKALSEQGNPRLSTVLKTMRAMGLRLHVGREVVQA